MKKKCYFAIVIAMFVGLSASAQLKVSSDNKVGIGVITPQEKLHVYGNAVFSGDPSVYNKSPLIKGSNYYTDHSGPNYTWQGDLTTGIYHPTQGQIGFATSGNETMRIENSRLLVYAWTDWNASIRVEASSADATAYAMKYGGQDNFFVHASGWLLHNGGSYLTSDRRYKTDIKPIDSPLNKVMSLNGIRYKKSEKFNVCNDNNEYLGVIAQDVEKVIPQVVKTLENGYKAVAYESIVPLLIEAIKEQQTKIETLEDLISQSENISTSIDFSEKSNRAILYQNQPNPFSTSTEIKFYIPESASKAMLYVYNMNGNQIKEFDIEERQNSSIVIEALDLQPGMYLYALIVDGKEIATKRMILTK